MKKLFYLLLCVAFLSTSCKKEKIAAPVTPPTTQTITADVTFYWIGHGNWACGQAYVESIYQTLRLAKSYNDILNNNFFYSSQPYLIQHVAPKIEQGIYWYQSTTGAQVPCNSYVPIIRTGTFTVTAGQNTTVNVM